MRWRCGTFDCLFLLSAVLGLVQLIPFASAGVHRHGNWYSWVPSETCCGRLRHHREHVRDFSCGKFYYRTFHIDVKREYIFVGAMDRLYRLSLYNINSSNCETDSLVLQPINVDNCVSKGKSKNYDCKNHIKVIQSMGDGSMLYICGTNAFQPMDWAVQVNTSQMKVAKDYPGTGEGAAKCPFDPDDNATAIWVEKGNPGGVAGLYSGTVAEFTKADTVIFRANLYNLTTGDLFHTFKRTIKYDSKWLDKPHFVGSFDIGDFVFFFFRESAVEYINCGKTIYSRVARVCKRDTGGKNILASNWASYLKARLNCSVPGDFPFYFNEIQNVYMLPDDDTTIYATFSTNMNGFIGSAICTYSLESILKVFNGKFKEQPASSSAWLPVLSRKVPEPRPGLCVNDSRTLPDSVLNFIRSHPLMDSAVAQDGGRPVFYRRDVVFTRIVVEKLIVSGVPITVYYAGTTDGMIYKIVNWQASPGDTHSNLVDTFEATYPDAVRALAVSPKHNSLYVSSDVVVRQISLVMCKSRYANCIQCVQDPHCGWDNEKKECKPYMEGTLQDIKNATPGICDNSVKQKFLHAFWGQSLHLSCTLHLPELEVLDLGPLRWFHYVQGKGNVNLVHPRKDKLIYTAEHGLVLMSVTERDTGRYDARIGSHTLCSYNISVDTKSCNAPSEADYRKIYSNWCHEFEKYKTAMKRWQVSHSKCDSSRMNDVSYPGSPQE